MLIDFGDAEGGPVEGGEPFDDGPLDDGANFEPDFSENFGGELPEQYTRYNVCDRWQKLIRESFTQSLGFFATSLNGSLLEHGDFSENPFRLKLVYPASFKWGYDQMMEREDYRKRLQTIFEDRLQTKVSVSYELLKPKPGENVLAVPLSPWETDVQKEPELGKFAKAFMVELVSTAVLRNADIPADESDDSASEPE